VQGVFFPECNHLLDKRPRRFGASESRSDALALDDVGDQIAQRRTAMRGIASEFASGIEMSHGRFPAA
jgi:hypothetical protein